MRICAQCVADVVLARLEPGGRLSPSEAEVLMRSLRGESLSEIARARRKSTSTAVAFRMRAYRKLGLPARARHTPLLELSYELGRAVERHGCAARESEAA